MQIPTLLLESLGEIKGFDKNAFEKVHLSGEQVTSIRLNPAKNLQISNHIFQIPWCEKGLYLAERPSFTFDPFFHAGCYYVQEASSMFLEQALKQTVDLSKPLKVLDLCAAPGGKSTHIQSLISKDSLLVSNEVIRSRANILKDNIIKWGSENVVVTNNDPKDLAKLENYFDVMVADAPCSGSGLFRRDPDAITEWSENNVQLCSQRQQRILADAWPALKKGGMLIYSTCSYSREEDEDIMDWISTALPSINCPLQVNPGWGITETKSENENFGYRFWPDKVKGEGFFIACFQKTDGDINNISPKFKSKPETLTKKELEIISAWAKPETMTLIRHINTVYAWPERLVPDFILLLGKLRVIYSGILVGELIREKLIPGHALAMSKRVASGVNTIPLSAAEAVKYLQRKEFYPETKSTGWQLVAYETHPLGWVNVLTNRINNYYPKELRILKDS